MDEWIMEGWRDDGGREEEMDRWMDELAKGWRGKS